jgi:glucuronate isomerase
MDTSRSLEERLLAAVAGLPAIDVHSHVDHRAPCARSLRELLAYHYYTELAHSAGMPKHLADPSVPDAEAVPALIGAMERIDNTVQYRWLTEIASTLFGLEGGRLGADNWERVAAAVAQSAERPGRAAEVMQASRISKVFLTNDFDEHLAAADTARFVPCLRADRLAFALHESGTREALAAATGVEIGDAAGLSRALGLVVERFARHGARSAAVSLPPEVRLGPVDAGNADRAVAAACRGGTEGAGAFLTSLVLWELAGRCCDLGLGFQVMFGAARGAYEHGVPQGRDLPVAGADLAGLLPLFNAFPDVTFCVSVLSMSQSQELNSYGWILHNVVPSGHWWYANVPEYIAADLAARLQSVPKTKLIGYYSDMYKLEFCLAKFNMYRRVLAHVLAGRFVEPGYGTEDDALRVAQMLLAGNAARIFGLEGVAA